MQVIWKGYPYLLKKRYIYKRVWVWTSPPPTPWPVDYQFFWLSSECLVIWNCIVTWYLCLCHVMNLVSRDDLILLTWQTYQERFPFSQYFRATGWMEWVKKQMTFGGNPLFPFQLVRTEIIIIIPFHWRKISICTAHAHSSSAMLFVGFLHHHARFFDLPARLQVWNWKRSSLPAWQKPFLLIQKSSGIGNRKFWQMESAPSENLKKS